MRAREVVLVALKKTQSRYQIFDRIKHRVFACVQQNGTKTGRATSLLMTAINQHQASRNTQVYRVQGPATDTYPIKKNSKGHQS